MILMLKFLQIQNKDVIIGNSKRLKLIYQSLVSRQLFDHTTALPTLLGKALMNYWEDDQDMIDDVPKQSDVTDSKCFDDWWNTFPNNDGFTLNGKTFDASRSLKSKKQDCKRVFDNITNSGTFTAQEIIDATKYDVEIRKRNSVKENKNNLKFLQNSYTYLNNKSFEGFVGLKLLNKQTPLIKGTRDI